jgi:pyruvate dehydrogenase E2 component (dihydrolipoamide acetyltransferase)
MIEFRMPSLGADMESGFLREWKVKTGDRVKRGDIIAEVETQKGIIDIEVFDEGVVGELLIKIDDKVPVGTLMTHILPAGEVSAGAAQTSKVTEGKTHIEITGKGEEKRIEPVSKPYAIHASPLAKRIASEKGIDLKTIKGSGPNGAITRQDVESALAARVAPETIKEKPASAAENIRMAVAAAMSKSNREVPHYYLETKIDMSHALTWLTEANKLRSVKDRLLPAVLLIKAVAKALGDVPDLNAWWDNGLQRKKDIHVGFVVSLRAGGIIVPAIHDADKKTLDEIMKSLSDIIPRARALRLRSSELADSTITITSLGEAGVETVYGVIYPPQVALVGFGGITEQPYADNGMLAVRPVLMATLAADHRATDGSAGSKFLTALKQYLHQPERL